MPDPNERPEAADEAPPSTRTDHDVLSGFNAAEIVDDPDDLEPEELHVPAATPDSPNPI